MDKETLQTHLHALATGKEAANTPVVEAYLADEQAGQLANLLKQVTGNTHLGKTPLLPPSSCLPLLD